jgi:hypothetical protein
LLLKFIGPEVPNTTEDLRELLPWLGRNIHL